MTQKSEQSNVRGSLTKGVLTLAGVALGNRFVRFLDEMQDAQWLSTDELFARSEKRLGSLLQHAAENVPYYRDLYARLGVQSDELRTIRDLHSLPVLTKSDYRRYEPQLFFDESACDSDRVARKTSGSTGEPFQFYLDRRTLPLVFASHLFYDSWHGLRPFDRYLRIIAPPSPHDPLPQDASMTLRLQRALTGRLQDLYESLTQQKISLWEVNSEGTENIFRRMEAFQPKFVMGYTSTLAAIADDLLRRNLRLSQSVQGVITIAETLTPNRKRLLEEYFDCPIINRYGLREFGSWSAQSCPESPDRFHLNTELVVCEILRPDGTPCASGENGRVVVTDLHNFARPFIRYDTGDVAVAVSEKCSCGRGFPLFGPVEGRSLDCLQTPSGNEISPAILGHFLFVYRDHLETVHQYQLVQEAADRVKLLIVPGERWNDTRRESLRSDLNQLLGAEMEVEVQAVSEIRPERSGKRPIIKKTERVAH